MNPEIIKQSLDSIKEKVGEESAAIIADDIGVILTAGNDASEKEKHYQDEIEKLKLSNSQLIAANSNLLSKIPVHEENQLVPSSQSEVPPSESVNPFDEYGRLKK